MSVKAEITFLKDNTFEVGTSPSGMTFYIDKKRDSDVTKGPNSLELFLSSLGGCIGVYAKKYLTRHEVEFSELRVNVTAELSQESPISLKDIKIIVHTDAILGDKRQVFERFIQECPVHNTLRYSKPVEISITG